MIACFVGPVSARENARVALEDAHAPILPSTGPCPCGCEHSAPSGELVGHHAMMNWKSKFPDSPDDEAFLTVEVADADMLNHVARVVEPHGWALRVHYPTPDAPQPRPERRIAATLDEMRRVIDEQARRIEALEGRR